MDKSVSDICFELFLDAVKRKDSMQFSYYSLYSAINNSEENILENDEEDALIF